MRGYIRKRAEGSWSITVSAGFDPVTGKRRQLHRTVRGTKRDAERARTELLRAIDQGIVADPGALRLADYLESWEQHMATRVRERTLKRYRDHLRIRVVPLIGALRLAKVRPVHVQQVVDAAVASRCAPQTVLSTYRVLSEALKQAVRLQLLPLNPAAAIQPPRVTHSRPVVPDPGQIARIVNAAKGTRTFVPLVLAATTGMRRGEVLGLRWDHVHLERCLARIVTTLQTTGSGGVHFLPPKTDRARRTVALPSTTVDVLRRHRREQAGRRLIAGSAWVDLGLVVDRGDGGALDPDTFSRQFRALARRVGLRGVRLHDLRHAYATQLLERGIHPAVTSEVLGHSTPAFTMAVYQHVNPSMSGQAARVIEEAFGGALSS